MQVQGPWKVTEQVVLCSHHKPDESTSPPTVLSHFLKIRVNIIQPSLPRSSKWSPSFIYLHQHPVSSSLLPLMCHTHYPLHTPLFDHPRNIWGDVQTIKLLTVRSPPLSCYFLSDRDIFLSVFSNILSFCSSFTVRHQVSSKTTGKLAVLYVSIFMLLDSKGEDGRFWTEWLQALPKCNLVLTSL